MPDRKIILSTGNIYHIINRGVEKRDIFTCDVDYYRFISDLYEFNDKDAVMRDFRYNLTSPDLVKLDQDKYKYEKKRRKLLVDILAFCLMPNHFHLLLRQKRHNGVSLFMHKLGGYVMYFNKKHERVGPLFQGRYKIVEITNDQQLNTIFSYIHTNPVELHEPLWKESGARNPKDVIKKLDSWRWSSYLDYIGRKNFPSVTSRDMFLGLFGGEVGCKRAVGDWVRYKAEAYEDWKDIALLD